MAGLRDLLRDGEKVRILAISRDSREESQGFAAKIAADGKGEPRFSLLSDPGSRTIDLYGLRDPAYAAMKLDGVPHPTVLVLDRAGIVRWLRVERDYRQRPANEEIREALDEIR